MTETEKRCFWVDERSELYVKYHDEEWGVPKYDDKKIEQLLKNEKIIRSRAKIEASVKNAKIFIEIQKEFGSFSKYIWGFTNGKIIKNKDDKFPVSTPLSDMVSKDLKKRGMKYTGTVIIYSYLQAIGVVNDHEINCYRYNKI